MLRVRWYIILIEMNNYLQLSKTAVSNLKDYADIYVVLGNESCDLDSAICAMVYGYFLYHYLGTSQKIAVIPVLNIQEDEFPLRTETKYYLQKYNITTGNLVFRNNLDIDGINKEGKLKLVLVDHHVLPGHDNNLSSSVIEVIDHRPIDPASNWTNISVIIDTVGSCATLVSKIIFDKKSDVLDEVIANLLLGTIILDTVNFNITARRFKLLDQDIVLKLEHKFNLTYSRDALYEELTRARSDVSTLTPFQILHRDMKIISGVPFPGVPMLVQDFLELPEAKESLKQFCQSKKVKVIVVMGLVTRENKVFRDIAVFAIEKCDLQETILNKLKDSQDLCLNEIENNVSGLTLFSQCNVQASRKHIVPILTNVINDVKDGNVL